MLTQNKTAVYQVVLESDGSLWKQEIRWDDEFGFVGHLNPEKTDIVPGGSIRLEVGGLEWEPVTSGCSVLAAWLCGE